MFRVTYRTERGDAARTASFSSALVFIPDTPRAAAVPAVVVAHGTAGQAPGCTPSKGTFASNEEPYAQLIFPLVGSGLVVIAPDYAGYANYGKQAPSGYAAAEDVGKSVLDGARALRKLLPRALSDKTVLVGHSQGSHSALSALAMAESYMPEAPIAAVVAYTPLWFSQASWGAMLFLADRFPVTTSGFPLFVGLWYHYSHGELLDGPGRGGDVFAEGKREAVKKLFDTTCVGADYRKAFEEIGVANALDLYDSTFIGAVRASAALGNDCGAEDALCKKWIARYAASRPHLKGAAAKVPILIPYGSSDDTIPPERMACGFERLKQNGANYKVCYVNAPAANHNGVTGLKADYVNDWIASQTLGTTAPPACDKDESALVDDAGAPVKCATPPPND
jgi:pimeloyl-ACP methyl ester carboxylesterase